MDELRIGQPTADSWIVLGGVTDPGVGYHLTQFHAELRGPGLHAASFVSSFEDRGGLAEFAATLADDWRGWEGVRVWEAAEHDMRIEAQCDHLGHVTMRVTLRQGYELGSWEATVVIVMDAGEELRSLAGDLNELLGSAST